MEFSANAGGLYRAEYKGSPTTRDGSKQKSRWSPFDGVLRAFLVGHRIGGA